MELFSTLNTNMFPKLIFFQYHNQLVLNTQANTESQLYVSNVDRVWSGNLLVQILDPHGRYLELCQCLIRGLITNLRSGLFLSEPLISSAILTSFSRNLYNGWGLNDPHDGQVVTFVLMEPQGPKIPIRRNFGFPQSKQQKNVLCILSKFVDLKVFS